jgi:hypothetical protein
MCLDTGESVMTAQEAAKLLLDGLRDPDYGDANIPGFSDIDWQKVYSEMTADHNESLEICGTHDWPATLVTALSAIAGEDCTMYKVRIQNTMYGYERDQIVEIVADSEKAALAKAQDIDCFAEVSIVR